MKKKLTGIILGILLLNFVGFSQKNNKRIQEKVEARRVAFISNKLNLTPTEAQIFWPLFNEYQDKIKALNQTYGGMTDLALLSDAEVASFIDKHLEKEEQYLKLKKAYFNNLKKVLPIRKVAMLPRVEKRFKEWIVEQIKERRGRN